MNHLTVVTTVASWRLIDGQTLSIRPTGGGGVITLNFTNPSQLSSFCSDLNDALDGADVPNPPYPANVALPPSPGRVINLAESGSQAVLDDSTTVGFLDDSGNAGLLDNSNEQQDTTNEEYDAFDSEAQLAEGVRRVDISSHSEDSFEPSYGVSQELW